MQMHDMMNVFSLRRLAADWDKRSTDKFSTRPKLVTWLTFIRLECRFSWIYIYMEPIYKIITDLEENEKYSTKDDNWDDDGQSSGSRYNRPSLPYYFLAYNFSFCGDLQK